MLKVFFKHCMYFQNKEQKDKECAIFKNSDLLDKCYDIVPYEPYFHLCEKDMCTSQPGTNTAMCIALEAYLRECAINGQNISFSLNSEIAEKCSKLIIFYGNFKILISLFYITVSILLFFFI